MVRLGRTSGNLMTNLVPASRKLKKRALRIVMALADVDEARAGELLEACEGDVNRAVERARETGTHG